MKRCFYDGLELDERGAVTLVHNDMELYACKDGHPFSSVIGPKLRGLAINSAANYDEQSADGLDALERISWSALDSMPICSVCGDTTPLEDMQNQRGTFMCDGCAEEDEWS